MKFVIFLSANCINDFMPDIADIIQPLKNAQQLKVNIMNDFVYL